MIRDDWYGLYRETWNREIMHSAAMKHPGKINPAVARELYALMFTAGWVVAGDHVLDPFAGVAGTAFHAMSFGLRWTGIEIVPENVELAIANLDKWWHMLAWVDGAGVGYVQQGDSRKPIYGVENVAAVVSSPPYADVLDGNGEGPAARYDFEHHAPANAVKVTSNPGYGSREGQMGEMDESEFWPAVAQVIANSRNVLRPGGVHAWITGDYIRNGRRVEFGKQWRDMCLQTGDEQIAHIRAWKVGDGYLQGALFAEQLADNRPRHYGQFRRQANRANPDAAVEHEDIWVFRKPLDK